MSNEDLKSGLSQLFPAVSFEESSGWTAMIIQPQEWLSIAIELRNNDHFDFDYLFCMTCIDWKTKFSVVYHLTSTTKRHILVIKAMLDHHHPAIETVSHIWRTAEFHEREIYDLFGVHFINHPDLRRLFMTDDWKGWPLRKDYEDPVNMIRL